MKRLDDHQFSDSVPHIPYVSEATYLNDREYILGTLKTVEKDVGDIKVMLAAQNAVSADRAANTASFTARKWAVRTTLLAAVISTTTAFAVPLLVR